MRSPSRQRSWWTILWIALAMGAIPSSVAQNQRGVEIMERTLAMTPDVKHGAALFVQHCAACHGEAATGNADEIIPSLAGQLPIYIVKQLADIAEGLRTAPEMHRVVARKPVDNLQAIRDLSAYLGGLPLNAAPEQGDGKNLELGARYYKGLCAYCHGDRGQGNEAHATPVLARQHYSYLSMQTRDLAAGHRYAVDPEIVEALEKLPYDQVTAIADYLSRMAAVSPLIGAPR